MHSPLQIAEDLTKEIMDSSFIPWKLKNEYLLSFSKLKKQRPKEIEVNFSESRLEYRTKTITMMSSLLGIMVATTTMFLTFYELLKSKDFLMFDITSFMIPILSSILILILTFYSALLYRRLKQKLDDVRFIIRRNKEIHYVDKEKKEL